MKFCIFLAIFIWFLRVWDHSTFLYFLKLAPIILQALFLLFLLIVSCFIYIKLIHKLLKLLSFLVKLLYLLRSNSVINIKIVVNFICFLINQDSWKGPKFYHFINYVCPAILITYWLIVIIEIPNLLVLNSVFI